MPNNNLILQKVKDTLKRLSKKSKNRVKFSNIEHGSSIFACPENRIFYTYIKCNTHVNANELNKLISSQTVLSFPELNDKFIDQFDCYSDGSFGGPLNLIYDGKSKKERNKKDSKST